MDRRLRVEEEDLNKSLSLTVKGISSIIDPLEKEDIGLN